ncbi:MAG: hypothetical protein ACRCV7_01500 [Culicoidibacterales bacterium]
MSCTFENEQSVIDKVREMGFENKETEVSHQIDCACGTTFLMETCLVHCPNCRSVYAVTPCHSDDYSSIAKGK